MKKNLFLILLSLLSCYGTNAQGCSDAGICSISNAHDEAEKRNQFEVGTIAGEGEAGIRYLSPYAAYTLHWNRHWSASAKVTSSFAEGEFGKRGSVGDAFLKLAYIPETAGTCSWTYTLGAKIPFNHANLKINNHPLPLDYQTSLGTFDLLAAVGLKYKAFDYNAALQIPVININRNSFFREYSGTDDFPTTNLFVRKPDALLQATYTIGPGNSKFSLKPNLLLVYHVGEDTYEDIYGSRHAIAGSSGVTLNGNLIGSFHSKSGNVLALSVAAPFIVRDIRPDGLTRAYTAALGYTIGF